VSAQGRVFGLRIYRRIFTGILASAFTGQLADWLFHACTARWRFVMRYRSATVADSHGLPLNLERNKRTVDSRRLHELGGFAQSFFVRAYLAKRHMHRNGSPFRVSFYRGIFCPRNPPENSFKKSVLDKRINIS